MPLRTNATPAVLALATNSVRATRFVPESRGARRLRSHMRALHGGRLERLSPRFVHAAQQSGIHQPTPERIDQRKIRPRPDADREDVDRPEKLIAIWCWLQSPNEEGVNCCIPDLTDRLHRVDVHNGERSIEGARLHQRLPPICVAEARPERPCFPFWSRTIPSQQASH